MAKRPKSKVLTVILSITILLVVVIGAMGLTFGRGFMAVVGRDKDFIRQQIEKPESSQPEVKKEISNLEKKLGKFKQISKIMGMANFGDITNGKGEYSYYAFCDFEKGEGTYIFRLNNDSETPRLLSVTSQEGHAKRKRVRQELLNQLR